jgi:hypothetical protein
MTLFRCLKCGAKLDDCSERYVCQKCGAEWPVVGGIPRFFQSPSCSWGEVDENKARAFLESAKNGSWVEAVRARFPERDNMTYGRPIFSTAQHLGVLTVSDMPRFSEEG